MKILDLQQGTEAWKAARKNYFTASEASIMMACSKNVSRNELLHMKATGTEQEFSDWFEKNILEKGHKVEALARPIAEEIIGEELFPVTGVIQEQKLLASFDGLTMLGDTAWECKQYNAEKVELIKRQEMPMVDYWQVAQQLIVSGASRCLYMVTDGTKENTHYLWISIPTDSHEKLLLGWNQFSDDLNNYKPTDLVSTAVIADTPEALPTLVVDLVGEVRSSNLAAFEDIVLQRIKAVKTDLQTDQDFADADATVKFFTKAEKQLEAVKEQALAQTSTIDQLFKTVDHLKSEMRNKRLKLNKLTKERKEQIRTNIILSAKQALAEHIQSAEADLGGYRLQSVTADFASAIKGKKSIETLKSAADDTLAQAKIQVTQQATAIKGNLEVLADLVGQYGFLFADKSALVLLEPGHLKAEIKARIADHKEKEQAKAEEERKRIRAEEEARIRQEQSVMQASIIEREQPKNLSDSHPSDSGRGPVTAHEAYRPMNELGAVEAEQTRTEMVSISLDEYNNLLKQSELLQALINAGVDNWHGWADANQQLQQAA